jgi:hypothetical protein
MTVVTMENAIFRDVTPHGSCANRRFGGTSVLKRATPHHLPEDGILHSQLFTIVASSKLYESLLSTVTLSSSKIHLFAHLLPLYISPFYFQPRSHLLLVNDTKTIHTQGGKRKYIKITQSDIPTSLTVGEDFKVENTKVITFRTKP